MPQSRYLRSSLAGWLFLVGSAAGAPSLALEGQSLLYNPGPKWMAGITMARTAEGMSCHIAGSSLREVGAVAGRPAQRKQTRHCVGGDVSGPQEGGPTFANDTHVGWFATDADKVPGWKVNQLGGGGGKPITWRYANLASGVEDACTLREVGIIYQGWPNKADSAFRLNKDGSRLTLGQFQSIKARFSARLVQDQGPPRCARMASGYITVDFRVIYYNNPEEAKTVRSDLVGVIIHKVPGAARSLVKAEDPAIYWKGANGPRTNLLLSGEALKPPVPKLTSEFRSYEIDFTKLVRYLPPPPPGYKLEDAVIVGLDVYSSVRGADITFDVTNVDLVGFPR